MRHSNKREAGYRNEIGALEKAAKDAEDIAASAQKEPTATKSLKEKYVTKLQCDMEAREEEVALRKLDETIEELATMEDSVCIGNLIIIITKIKIIIGQTRGPYCTVPVLYRAGYLPRLCCAVPALYLATLYRTCIVPCVVPYLRCAVAALYLATLYRSYIVPYLCCTVPALCCSCIELFFVKSVYANKKIK